MGAGRIDPKQEDFVENMRVFFQQMIRKKRFVAFFNQQFSKCCRIKRRFLCSTHTLPPDNKTIRTSKTIHNLIANFSIKLESMQFDNFLIHLELRKIVPARRKAADSFKYGKAKQRRSGGFA